MLQSLDWSVMYETGEGCWSQICLTAKINAVLDCRHSTGSHQLFSWEGLTDSYTPLTDWMSVTLCLCVTRSDWPVVRSCGHSFISITTGDWFVTLAWLQPKQPCDPLIRRATGRSRFAAKFKETGEKQVSCICGLFLISELRYSARTQWKKLAVLGLQSRHHSYGLRPNI